MVHRVPVADSHLVVVDGVEVDSYAIGRANLVLTAVTAADGLGIIILRLEMLTKYVVDPPRGRQQLVVPAQGQRGYGDWCKVAMDVGYHADVVAVGFFVIGVQPEGQGGPVDTARWLDHVGQVSPVIAFF